jgi:hypothetical protein
VSAEPRVGVPGRWRARAGRALLALVSVAVALALVEGGFALLLHAPVLLRYLPANVGAHVRGYYGNMERDIVQSDPQCARWDPQLTYTLRPGTCRFVNREYETELAVNRLGVRDSESALERPELVVLGDSFAMGWGVRQEESFPARLATLTGLRTLNLGVPSYGTVREVKLLSRVDVSRLRCLVIQYSDNDYGENRALQLHHGRLPIRSRASFEAAVAAYQRGRRYFFGKYTYEILRRIVRPAQPSAVVGPRRPLREARLFLRVLARSPVLSRRDLRVIVLELSPRERLTPRFAGALRALLARDGWGPPLADAQVLDMASVLRPEDFFDLDDHLRESGHERVARAVAAALARANGASPP